VVICIADGSHFARERLMAFTLWHPDAVSGSHPPHLLSGVIQTSDSKDVTSAFGPISDISGTIRGRVTKQELAWKLYQGPF
jgi:hypothetical protein